MAYLKIHVTPSARQDTLAGWQGDILRLKVRAAPKWRRANQAACRLLAQRLGIPSGHVTLARGATSKDKLVYIDGLSDEEVRRRLPT